MLGMSSSLPAVGGVAVAVLCALAHQASASPPADAAHAAPAPVSGWAGWIVPPRARTGWRPGVFEDSSTFAARCAAPRPGRNDLQGTVLDQNNWLRSWSHELYLWYDEIRDADPACCPTPEYFDLQKTEARTPSGNPKDRFHYSYETDYWEQLAQSGIQPGYGIEWAVISASPPREVAIAFTEPESPARAARLARGARIVAVDGVDVENGSDVHTLNAGLSPSAVGESHEFVVRDLGASADRTVVLTAVEVAAHPVQQVRVLDTPSGPVGYMLFNAHLAPAERQLLEAVRGFRDQGVVDLVVDLRYNGGGFLDIANQLAFMVAGDAPTGGRVFGRLRFNDKHTVYNPVTGRRLEPDPFHRRTLGFSTGLPAGEPLPTLDLRRVYVLTTGATCSASEAFINGLRGIDVEVIQIGSTTCGKPFGFYPTDNCGVTYFSVQFQSVNEKGFGDYPDGFSPENLGRTEGVPVPGCSAADDFDHGLGDIEEGLLAAALDYRAEGACPVPSEAPRKALQPPLGPDGRAGGAVAGPRRPGGAWLRR